MPGLCPILLLAIVASASSLSVFRNAQNRERNFLVPPSKGIFQSSSQPHGDDWVNYDELDTPAPALMDRVKCLIAAAHSVGQKPSLFQALVCTKYRHCDDGLLRLAESCTETQCDTSCRVSADPEACLELCMESTIPSLEQANAAQDIVTSVVKPPNKRYRLGLYDCISSYCSALHGEDRKSCIVYYCHRSSTAQ